MAIRFYPVGTPGVAWSGAELSAWRARQKRQRSYFDEVVTRIEATAQSTGMELQQYGALDYEHNYPLFALKSPDWRPERPLALITGGVHGYETSGVHGALSFAAQHAQKYLGRMDLLLAPCVSPWGYEHIQRWNPQAKDPNRSFFAGSQVAEAELLMRLLADTGRTALVHVDLHETTDTDESEFRPALAARDGKEFSAGSIPDGFYLVDDSHAPQADFQQAIIEAVAKITHIAPADAQGQIIGSEIHGHGVIRYDLRALGLCAGFSGARFKTTTEVYPDSPLASAEICNRAQSAAVVAALDFALEHQE